MDHSYICQRIDCVLPWFLSNSIHWSVYIKRDCIPDPEHSLVITCDERIKPKRYHLYCQKCKHKMTSILGYEFVSQLTEFLSIDLDWDFDGNEEEERLKREREHEERQARYRKEEEQRQREYLELSEKQKQENERIIQQWTQEESAVEKKQEPILNLNPVQKQYVEATIFYASKEGYEITQTQALAFINDWWGWYTGYYLKSPSWRNKKNHIVQRDDICCRNCFQGYDLRVHHFKTKVDSEGKKAYDYVKPWLPYGQEPAHLLITLCSSCHDGVHGKGCLPLSESELTIGDGLCLSL